LESTFGKDVEDDLFGYYAENRCTIDNLAHLIIIIMITRFGYSTRFGFIII